MTWLLHRQNGWKGGDQNMSGKNPALSGVEGGKAQAEPGTTQVGHVHSGSGVWFSSVRQTPARCLV